MSITNDELLGYQNAEFKRSSRLRVGMISVQLALGAPVVASVYTDNERTLYYLALLDVVLLAVWFVLEGMLRRSRLAAERTRRATLVMGGLGEQISSAALRGILECITVSPAEAKANENPSFFASKETPGAKRLVEMLEESGFWTYHLQRASSHVMWAVFAAFAVILALVTSYVIGSEDNSHQIQTVRVLLAGLTVFMSADIMGAARMHGATADQIEMLVARLVEVHARGYKMPDVLLALSDYNAFVEATPPTVPFLYKIHHERLERLWSEYLAAR